MLVMKFYIYTLGCKVNAYESEVMKEKLLASHYVYEEDSPDIVIINTCSVTNIADQKSRKMVRQFKKKHPNAVLVVAGCSSFHKQEEYQAMGIDILLGNQKKSQIVELLEEYFQSHQPYVFFSKSRQLPFEDMQIDKFTTHTRAYVKVQDGCDNFCSYCVIPYVRGSIRSKDFQTAIQEVQTLVLNGHQEIVLTGIHTGSYGYGTEHDLTDLIHEISQFEGLKRIRISSIEVTELNDKFLGELASNPKICNHMHIPLQAGSDEILKRMNRKYTLEEFGAKLKQIREIRPDIAITTDIIVGFPGETEELFLKTMAIAKEFQFSKIHVFPYSLREGTKAAVMDGHVSNEEKHERSKRLTELSKELERDYAMKFLGKEVDVLIERNNEGFTSNYLRVRSDQDISNNTLVTLEIVDIQNDECIGKVVS